MMRLAGATMLLSGVQVPNEIGSDSFSQVLKKVEGTDDSNFGIQAWSKMAAEKGLLFEKLDPELIKLFMSEQVVGQFPEERLEVRSDHRAEDEAQHPGYVLVGTDGVEIPSTVAEALTMVLAADPSVIQDEKAKEVQTKANVKVDGTTFTVRQIAGYLGDWYKAYVAESNKEARDSVAAPMKSLLKAQVDKFPLDKQLLEAKARLARAEKEYNEYAGVEGEMQLRPWREAQEQARKEEEEVLKLRREIASLKAGEAVLRNQAAALKRKHEGADTAEKKYEIAEKLAMIMDQAQTSTAKREASEAELRKLEDERASFYPVLNAGVRAIKGPHQDKWEKHPLQSEKFAEAETERFTELDSIWSAKYEEVERAQKAVKEIEEKMAAAEEAVKEASKAVEEPLAKQIELLIEINGHKLPQERIRELFRVFFQQKHVSIEFFHDVFAGFITDAVARLDKDALNAHAVIVNDTEYLKTDADYLAKKDQLAALQEKDADYKKKWAHLEKTTKQLEALAQQEQDHMDTWREKLQNARHSRDGFSTALTTFRQNTKPSLEKGKVEALEKLKAFHDSLPDPNQLSQEQSEILETLRKEAESYPSLLREEKDLERKLGFFTEEADRWSTRIQMFEKKKAELIEAEREAGSAFGVAEKKRDEEQKKFVTEALKPLRNFFEVVGMVKAGEECLTGVYSQEEFRSPLVLPTNADDRRAVEGAIRGHTALSKLLYNSDDDGQRRVVDDRELGSKFIDQYSEKLLSYNRENEQPRLASGEPLLSCLVSAFHPGINSDSRLNTGRLMNVAEDNARKEWSTVPVPHYKNLGVLLGFDSLDKFRPLTKIIVDEGEESKKFEVEVTNHGQANSSITTRVADDNEALTAEEVAALHPRDLEEQRSLARTYKVTANTRSTVFYGSLFLGGAPLEEGVIDEVVKRIANRLLRAAVVPDEKQETGMAGWKIALIIVLPLIAGALAGFFIWKFCCNKKETAVEV
ncbi:unnamed protein product [Amoebophrya sp. A25]|nr:unnamed protein product [Amoebophrya sp. A25]|eukprot:GSA25T00015891001.1